MKKLFRFSAGTIRKKVFALPSVEHDYLAGEFRARGIVIFVLVLGTIFLSFLFTLLLLHSYFIAGNSYVLPRVVASSFVLLYNVFIYVLARKGFYKVAGFLVVGTYTLIALMCIWVWGTNVPFGIVMMSLGIILAGILLGSRSSLYWMVGFCVSLVTFQTLQVAGIHNPDLRWVTEVPNFGHVFGHCVLLGIIGLISWLFGSQTERSLIKATKAEAALMKEKQSLAKRLEERTEALRLIQLKEMQQLYRFAELGQLSTALLHDLANHLTVLTLDIEDLNKNQHSQAIKRAKKSIFYLDRMVDQVRSQLQGSSHISTFSVAEKIQETIALLNDRLVNHNVQAELITSKRTEVVKCQGDPVRLQQIFTILITNAIDAYKKSQLEISDRRILIGVKLTGNTIEISIRDWGVGIAKEERQKLFKPFYSTKEEGMGIGLFIAKQMLETHFKGTIAISDTDVHTEFIVTIPRAMQNVKSK